MPETIQLFTRQPYNSIAVSTVADGRYWLDQHYRIGEQSAADEILSRFASHAGRWRDDHCDRIIQDLGRYHFWAVKKEQPFMVWFDVTGEEIKRPSLGSLNVWFYQDTCPTPDGRIVKFNDPDSWLVQMGLLGAGDFEQTPF